MPNRPRHHFALVFRCADASLFAVVAPDPADAERRMNAEGPKYGRLRDLLPMTLAYAEEHMSAESALRGVKAITRLSRAKKETLLCTWIPPQD